MSEPRWLSPTAVLAVHSDQIRSHGGSLGLKDRGLIDSALNRASNRYHYEPDSDLCRLGACYGYGIARNHPFVDGNKRVAFQAMYLFLGLNGLRIDTREEEVVVLMQNLASGQVDETQLSSWLRDHTIQR